MFSVRQKREISEAVQKILRDTHHPELPQEGEIQFLLRVEGAESWSWAEIRNNGAILSPDVNPWNEAQDCLHSECYYNEEHDNFYCRKCKMGMGSEFYTNHYAVRKSPKYKF